MNPSVGAGLSRVRFARGKMHVVDALQLAVFEQVRLEVGWELGITAHGLRSVYAQSTLRVLQSSVGFAEVGRRPSTQTLPRLRSILHPLEPRRPQVRTVIISKGARRINDLIKAIFDLVINRQVIHVPNLLLLLLGLNVIVGAGVSGGVVV